MSERGSFVTENIACPVCFAAASMILVANEKYLRGVQIPMWGDAPGVLPIIAGKVGGTWAGEELHEFEFEYIPRLESVLCHPMRIAVLAEKGERIFRALPTTANKAKA